MHGLSLAVLVFAAAESQPVPAPAEKPSVAVLKLQARHRVTADAADLLTSNLVIQIRATERFSKVVSS